MFGIDDDMTPAGPRPAAAGPYDQDTLSGIVKRYLTPAFQVAVHEVTSVGTKTSHPVVWVPSHDLITHRAQPVSQCGPYSCKWLKGREPDRARNRIQFQKGYSLVRFMDEYGTQDKCREALFRWRWANGFVCPRCEHTGHCLVQSRWLYQCRGCRHQVSLTAGTIFASTKLPLRTWFLAMYLMTHTKNGVSALELSVSYNTAWQVRHKLMQVMKERDDTRPLGGWVPLDDAYWGRQCRGGKTGRGAPGKTPFVAGVELNREGRPVRMRLSRVGGFRSEQSAAWARLEPGTVVVSDGLGGFAAVKRPGGFHHPFVTGGGPASARHPALTWVNTSPGNIKRSLHGTYHHLSSKHLPRYLAELSYRFFASPDVSPTRIRRPAHSPHALTSAQTG